MNIIHNCDCLAFMRDLPDNTFDLAIVDPPYGIKCGDQRRQKSRTKLAPATDYIYSGWDNEPERPEYFTELLRVSRNQIIFGAHHFISRIPLDSPGWIVWDKHTTGHFADCELAYTSFAKPVRKFDYPWNGMIRGHHGNRSKQEKRIHPTQKPVALYKWILKTYTEPGWTIFDSHVGSGSSRIACFDLGFDFVGCELDPDYWQAQEDRFTRYTSQQRLFMGDGA